MKVTRQARWSASGLARIAWIARGTSANEAARAPIPRVAPASRWAWIPILTLALLVPSSALAQTAETRAYTAGVAAFEDGAFDLADKYFAEFLQTQPNSPRVPEAILYRARAALRQQQTKAATDLLTTNATRAGPLADQYQYWLAEAYRQSTNFQGAAETFALLIRDFPASPRLLEASFGEALARFKLQEWPKVIDLLRNTNNTFQQQAQQRPNDELVIRGHVLLAEALLETDKASEADTVLRSLADRELIPEFRWRVQYLLSRGQLAAGRAPGALTSSTNLAALAAATGQRQLLAESHALRGAVLERLNDYPAAILEYEKNVTETTPPEYRRQALLRIIELTLDQNKIAEAAQKLESFFAQYPQDAASEVALLTLGELNLKRHLEGRATRVPKRVPNSPEQNGRALDSRSSSLQSPTNFLDVAAAQFDRLITNSPASPFVGKAHLNRGWCLWFNGKIPEAQVAFQAAVDKLPRSEDEAVAQFKIADSQFQSGNFTNAIASYRALITNYHRFPRVQEELAGHALYQIVRASLEVNDLPAAAGALQQIVRSYGESPFAERGLLLLGQSLTHADKPDEARALFERFLAKYPNSPLRPEVELAVARSHLEEQNWNAALQQYESWLQRFGTNEMRARAEFNYAQASYHAGRLTNAFNTFTNFLAKFPTDTNAPAAKYWIGSYYYDQKQYAVAEEHFQQLFQNTNWPVTTLSYDARMMAARAAAARQDYRAVHQYCLAIGNDPNCPPDLTAEALFTIGDVLVQGPADPGKPFVKFEEGIIAFSKVVQLFPTNNRATLAWGRIGDYNRQMASQDPKFYEYATNAYYQVLAAPNAGVSARSQAEVGLGQINEQLAKTIDPALWKVAFNHYYNVVSGRNLGDADKVDPYWYKEAGLAAARLAEEHQQWEVAIRIYTRLIEVLPPLRPSLQKKIEKAREQLRGSE